MAPTAPQLWPLQRRHCCWSKALCILMAVSGNCCAGTTWCSPWWQRHCRVHTGDDVPLPRQGNRGLWLMAARTRLQWRRQWRWRHAAQLQGGDAAGRTASRHGRLRRASAALPRCDTSRALFSLRRTAAGAAPAQPRCCRQDEQCMGALRARLCRR
ncbi:hypothetical protein JKP88DRAFT_252121 [Tribonema minus]|uniref:Uncharacterized protein n=1 Tax=Tribonema minus TaxID=303371 RepID=A0A836CL68_9STRA|nr:hypothetical protein JKP88DRAFT_252121 [Tribonema minus]